MHIEVRWLYCTVYLEIKPHTNIQGERTHTLAGYFPSAY